MAPARGDWLVVSKTDRKDLLEEEEESCIDPPDPSAGSRTAILRQRAPAGWCASPSGKRELLPN
jgi:hypothetical protein